MLDFGYIIQEVFVNPDKNLILTSSNLGIVSAYNVDFYNDKYSLLIVDQAQPE